LDKLDQSDKSSFSCRDEGMEKEKRDRRRFGPAWSTRGFNGFPIFMVKNHKNGQISNFQIWKILQISKIANYEVTDLTAKV
jgi:hypothetical protein